MCSVETGITRVLKSWAYLWQEIISWLLDILGHLISLGWNILVNELLYFEKTSMFLLISTCYILLSSVIAAVGDSVASTHLQDVFALTFFSSHLKLKFT